MFAAGSRRSHSQMAGAASPSEVVRRVQPRLSHAHAHTATGDEAEASAAAASAAAPAPLPHLHRHALESIFAFLPLTTFAAVTHVSKAWCAAVLSMAPHLLVYVPSREEHLRPLLHSPLRRRVSHLSMSLQSLCSSAELAQLADRMSHLRELDAFLGDISAIFPPQLRSLRVVQSSGVTQAVIDAIAHLQHLTSLRWNDVAPGVHLAPLTQVNTLTALEPLECGKHADDVAAFARQLRAVHQLRSLQACSSERCILPLSVLLAPPHQCQLTDLQAACHSQAEAALLASLPTLTRLQQLGFPLPHADFLTSLPALTTLRIVFAGGNQVDVPRCLAALQTCTRMQELTMHSTCFHVTSTQLASCLQRMPLLHTLSLGRCQGLQSLAFLSAGSLRSTLTALRLSECAPRLPLTEMQHVYALRHLRELELSDRLFSSALHFPQLRFHTPPSPLLPQLEEFAYVRSHQPGSSPEYAVYAYRPERAHAWAARRGEEGGEGSSSNAEPPQGHGQHSVDVPCCMTVLQSCTC